MKRIVLVGLLLLVACGISYGQGCALCSQVAASLGDKGARGLNGGIIYLALLPLAIIGTVSVLWWKNNPHGE